MIALVVGSLLNYQVFHPHFWSESEFKCLYCDSYRQAILPFDSDQTWVWEWNIFVNCRLAQLLLLVLLLYIYGRSVSLGGQPQTHRMDWLVLYTGKLQFTCKASIPLQMDDPVAITKHAYAPHIGSYNPFGQGSSSGHTSANRQIYSRFRANESQKQMHCDVSRT